MTLPTCYTPHRLSLLDKLIGDDCENTFSVLITIFFNHCFAKADFLTVRSYNNSVQLLQLYGRTDYVDEQLIKYDIELLKKEMVSQDEWHVTSPSINALIAEAVEQFAEEKAIELECQYELKTGQGYKKSIRIPFLSDSESNNGN